MEIWFMFINLEKKEQSLSTEKPQAFSVIMFK